MPNKSKLNSEVLKDNSDELISHFDYKALFEKLGGNDVFISDILDLGKIEMVENLPLLQEAFLIKDFDNLEAIVHRLRGAASAIEFNLLYHYLTLFENDIHSNITDNQKFVNVKSEIEYLLLKVLV